MTIMTPVEQQKSTSHKDAEKSVEHWRGRCVGLFAKLEQAIARFVIEHAPSSPVSGFGLGCRLRQLEALIVTRSDTKNLLKTLKEFESLHSARSAIVHGAGPVYLDADGHWLWDATFFETGANSPTHLVVRHNDAPTIEKRLRRAVQSISDQLRCLAATMKADPGSCPG